MKQLVYFMLGLLLFPVWIVWREHERRVLLQRPTDCSEEDVPIVYEELSR